MSIKLLADSMLGRLAKWLRLLGYDTAYVRAIPDEALLGLARAEGRTILTRDQRLARRRGLRALYVQSDDLPQQVRQVVRDLRLRTTGRAPRCPVCNRELISVAKRSIRERVPAYVYRTQREFSRCPQCERIYWAGTHWQRIRDQLRAWEAS